MFGSPSPKILRLDSLRERFVVSDTEKGRGSVMRFVDIKSVQIDDIYATHVIVTPVNPRTRDMKFNMETPEVTSQFVQKLETLVQSKKISTLNKL